KAMEVLTALDIAVPAPVPVAQLPARLAPAKPVIPTRLAVGFGLAALAFLLIGERLMPPAPVEAPAPTTSVQPPPEPRPEAKRAVAEPPPPTVEATLAVLERHAPPGRTCADVQFGAVAAVEQPVAAGQPSALDGLCGLSLAVNAGPQPAYVAVG